MDFYLRSSNLHTFFCIIDLYNSYSTSTTIYISSFYYSLTHQHFFRVEKVSSAFYKLALPIVNISRVDCKRI